jgi:hypothetical protein
MKFLAILISLLVVFPLYGQTGNLKGIVNDGENPIPLANVIIINTIFGAGTDTDGNYSIKQIPVGNYQVRFTSVGHETKVLDITISANKTLELNVVLRERAIEVDAVEVTGRKQQDQRDTRTSLIDLNPRQAKILPGAVEDVFRTLQSLPGVLAPNDFSSQLVIRGSGPDQNLIVFDDIEVFNPYRLYGVVSMFNPDAVSDVNLITGGFPAKYGDRLSAVLDVTNREGNSSHNLIGSLNASIVSANLVLEGKNPFNVTGSWLVNSRRTYYDLIIEPFVKSAGLVDDNTTFPNFYDLQTKLVFGPFSGNKILIDGIISRDGVNVVSGKDRNTPDSVGVYNITQNDLAGISWHYSPDKNLMNKFILSYYKNKGTTDFESEVLDPSLNRNSFENTIPDTLAPYLLNFNFNGIFSYYKYSVDDKLTYISGDHIFDAGIGVDFFKSVIDFNFDIDPELKAIFAANPQFRAVLSDLKDIKYYNRYHAYVQDNYKVTSRFFFQPSLRLDYYDILDKVYLAPRVSFSYALDDITTLRAMWGLYYQSPGYEKLLDGGVLYNLSDNYTHQLTAERAIHYVVGIERWLSSEWNVKLEGYYKDFGNLYHQQIVHGSSYFTEPIPGKNQKYPSGWTLPATVIGDSVTQIPVDGSYGEAYGLEFFLAKKNILPGSRLSGWVSYAIAFANRIEDGKKYPFRFDQRNTVNLVLNYKVNSWLECGIRWQYGSGFPYSKPLGIKPRVILADLNLDGTPETPVIATRKGSENSDGEEQVIYDIDFGNHKLNARKPEYHRLDVRINFAADYWDLDWIFYIDVINVYNHSNIIGYDYYITDKLTLGRDATTMFPIIPTLGFSIKF